MFLFWQQNGSFHFLCLENIYIISVLNSTKQRSFSEIYIYTKINLYGLEAKRCYIVLPSRSLCEFLELGICQHITWPLAGLVLPGTYLDTALIRVPLRAEVWEDVRAQSQGGQSFLEGNISRGLFWVIIYCVITENSPGLEKYMPAFLC